MDSGLSSVMAGTVSDGGSDHLGAGGGRGDVLVLGQQGDAAPGERLAERADGLAGLGDVDQVAVVEHRGPVAHLADQVGGVGDEEDRAALALELLDPVDALALERLVADRQHLVDEQDVGLDVDGDREAEPGVHARRVVLDLVVDELARARRSRRCRRRSRRSALARSRGSSR